MEGGIKRKAEETIVGTSNKVFDTVSVEKSKALLLGMNEEQCKKLLADAALYIPGVLSYIKEAVLINKF